MSIWILIVVLTAGLSVALVLDGAARWNQSSSLVLDHYEQLLADSRERAAASEAAESNTAAADPPSAAPEPDPD